MTNITTYQQLRANVQQINLIKATNHMLLSKFVSSDEFLDLLNETRLSAEPIETYVIDNTVQNIYVMNVDGKSVKISIKKCMKTATNMINATFAAKIASNVKTPMLF